MATITSVIFKRPIEMKEAVDFLKRHDYKYHKVDIEPHVYRFRQRDPKPFEAANYRFRMVPFKLGYFLIAYPSQKMITKTITG